MANQSDIQTLVQNLAGTHTAGQQNVPSGVNNGSPNTIYNVSPNTPQAGPNGQWWMPGYSNAVGFDFGNTGSGNILDVLPSWGGGILNPGTGTPPPGGGTTPPPPGNPGTGGITTPIGSGNPRPGGGWNVTGPNTVTQPNFGGSFQVTPGSVSTPTGTNQQGFFSDAGGLWGISPWLADQLGLNQNGGMDWQQLLDVVSELIPGLQGDLWNSQTNTWNQEALAMLAGGQIAGPLGREIARLVSENPDAGQNYLSGALNMSQARMQNLLASNLNNQFQNMFTNWSANFQNQQTQNLTNQANGRMDALMQLIQDQINAGNSPSGGTGGNNTGGGNTVGTPQAPSRNYGQSAGSFTPWGASVISNGSWLDSNGNINMDSGSAAAGFGVGSTNSGSAGSIALADAQRQQAMNKV